MRSAARRRSSTDRARSPPQPSRRVRRPRRRPRATGASPCPPRRARSPPGGSAAPRPGDRPVDRGDAYSCCSCVRSSRLHSRSARRERSTWRRTSRCRRTASSARCSSRRRRCSLGGLPLDLALSPSTLEPDLPCAGSAYETDRGGRHERNGRPSSCSVPTASGHGTRRRCVPATAPLQPRSVTSETGRSLESALRVGYGPALLRGLPPPRRRLQRRVLPAAVGRVDVHPRRDDLVDPVQQRVLDDEVRRGQLTLELLHRPRADDRRGDRRVPRDPRDRQLDERDARLVGELRELVGRLELGLVRRQRQVVAVGQPPARGRRRSAMSAPLR